MKKDPKWWTDEEIELFKKEYPCNPNILDLFPKRNIRSLWSKARDLGIKRIYRPPRDKYGDLSILLEETHLTYYWLGFLMADGHFGEKHLKLGLGIEDLDHLYRYKEFINYSEEVKIYKNKPQVTVRDSIVVPKIKEKFNISNTKTYNPCDISAIKGDFLTCFIIGFIDGDGCIQKRVDKKRPNSDCINIAIKVHSSWKENIDYMCKFISEQTGTRYIESIINSKGYCRTIFSNILIHQFLKRKTIEFELPVLKRKWDKINENKIGRNQQSKINEENVLRLLNEGYNNCTEIGEILGFHSATISLIRKKLGMNTGRYNSNTKRRGY